MKNMSDELLTTLHGTKILYLGIYSFLYVKVIFTKIWIDLQNLNIQIHAFQTLVTDSDFNKL